MHVGLVVYGGLAERSGGYRYDRKLVEHLRSRGEEVEVIAIPRRTYPRHLTDTLSRSLRRRLDRPFDVLLQDELCHPSLWRHNPRLEEPDTIVALVHLLRSGGPPARLDPLYRRVERRYLETVDAAVCTSRDTRTRTRALAALPATVAHPAGREEGAAITPEQVAKRARNDPFRVLFVGNLLPRKGVLTLLEALESFGGIWRADVVGGAADSSHAARLERAARGEFPGRVALHGAVPDGALRRLFARADVIAVPSTYEGFGMVYLEAMEYGVVPVASSVGGADEIVADGINGCLVPPDDPAALRATLSDLRDDRETLARRGRCALRTAAAHPSWAASMERVREFLRECVGRRDGQTRGDVGTAGRTERREPVGEDGSAAGDGTPNPAAEATPDGTGGLERW